MALVESGSSARLGTRGDTLYNVQALRGLAAMIVVCLHLYPLFTELGLVSPGGGVELFFVISGFIMVYTTYGRPSEPAKFLKNRIARIVPIYWFFTIFILACAVAAPGLFKNTSGSAIDLVKSLLFIPFQKGDAIRPLLYVGWTLNYEMTFYVIFAVGLLFRRYRDTLIFIMAVLAVLGVSSFFVTATGVFPRFYLNAAMLLFCFGIAVALLTVGRPAPVFRGARGVFGAGLAVCLVPMMLDEQLFAFAHRSLIAGLFASVVLYCAINLERLGLRIHNRMLLRIGDASYSIYLSQAFLAAAVVKLATRLPATPPVTLALLLFGLAVTAVAGWLIHIWIERPLTGVARRLLAGRRDAAPALA